MTQTIQLAELASAPFKVQAATLRELFGFTKSEFANILGVSDKTVGRWEKDGADSSPHTQNRQSIEALITIAESLGDLFEPDVIKVWVDRPNPSLGGERPRDYVKKPGGIFIIANLLGTVGR